MSEESTSYILELVYQVYEDGDKFEWFCEQIDTNEEAVSPTFRLIHYLMKGDSS